MELTLSKPRSPAWLTATAIFGLAWNAYGALQFYGSVTATPEALIANGLTAEQAAVMTSTPGWMTGAFAVGVLGGFVGSALLLLRSEHALPVLMASLVAYIALFIGDITEGVFAAMGAPQVIILSVVVLIAAGLAVAAQKARTLSQP